MCPSSRRGVVILPPASKSILLLRSQARGQFQARGPSQCFGKILLNEDLPAISRLQVMSNMNQEQLHEAGDVPQLWGERCDSACPIPRFQARGRFHQFQASGRFHCYGKILLTSTPEINRHVLSRQGSFRIMELRLVMCLSSRESVVILPPGARPISPMSGAGPISLLRFPRVRNLSCLSLLREVFVRPPSGARAISGAGPISLREGADFTAPPHRGRWRSNPSGKSSKSG